MGFVGQDSRLVAIPRVPAALWIPAFAGMTERSEDRGFDLSLAPPAYSIRLPPQARDTPAAVGSTMAFITAGLPLSNARWRAGFTSFGSSTFSP